MKPIDQLLEELEQIQTPEQLTEFYQKYLGKKGELAAEFKKLGSLEPEQRKTRWAELSQIKTTLEESFKKRQDQIRRQIRDKQMQNDPVGFATPPQNFKLGHYSLIEQELRIISKIFYRLGFRIEEGPRIVDKKNNFYLLNIPKDHPATEMQDTFYVNLKDEDGEYKVLRTHTSSYQVPLLKKYGAPLKAVIPGKVFRNEKMDASHDMWFWQLEWLYVDKNVNVGTFKHIMEEFLTLYFGTKTHIRLRPSYFPFVEPGFEIDVSCPICKWEGCRLCKHTGWIELLGAWIVHPEVIKNWGLDPQIRRGFAFGVGINRLVAIKYEIPDIRLLTSWDLRFSQSF